MLRGRGQFLQSVESKDVNELVPILDDIPCDNVLATFLSSAMRRRNSTNTAV